MVAILQHDLTLCRKWLTLHGELEVYRLYLGHHQDMFPRWPWLLNEWADPYNQLNHKNILQLNNKMFRHKHWTGLNHHKDIIAQKH